PHNGQLRAVDNSGKDAPRQSHLRSGAEEDCSVPTDFRCLTSRRAREVPSQRTPLARRPKTRQGGPMPTHRTWIVAGLLVLLSGLHAARADKIVAGGLATCAITSQGALYCWGDNQYGELGIGHNVNLTRPVHTVADYTSGVTDVAVGYQFACAIVNGA